jgi:pimeloyl-ACP methyl ester carboxylesterase
MGRRAKNTVIVSLVVAVAVLAGIIALVVLRQESLIYFPRAYSATELDAVAPALALEYVTEQGTQTAFLLLPQGNSVEAPLRLWVLFAGNASLALHWLEFTRAFPGAQTAFLLVDYPGYGRCEGHPSPDAIRRSSEAALKRALEHPSLQSRQLRIGALGHSLGASAALLLASGNQVDDLVLLAPFTSMLEMARRTVGNPLAQLLRHRFDNRARLAEILERFPPTRVTIVHGARDEVVPVSMGRELASTAPGRITYVEFPDADHNALAVLYNQQIYRLMLGNAPGTRSSKP